MTDHRASYQQAKERLNPAQRLAVETVFGPVLAIAGPGTGKTQVLTLRIAEILVKTDTHPRNILALTFTDAGATAMRERLKTFIGPDAHAVRIATFHGFCSEIIARFPEKFYTSRRLETAEGTVKLKTMKSILESGEYRRLVSLNAPNFYLKSILSRISQLKREGFAPEDFAKVVAAQKAAFDDLPDSEKINPKTGQLKSKYADEQKKIERWVELTDVYRRYAEELKKAGLIDYDDQISLVLLALKNDEELRAAVREETLFLLSDEFQDSNGAQMELLEIIAGDEEQPNLFAVGDDDQSIYRFQGANLENIKRFMRRYPQAVRIPLTQNYRSTPEVIAFAEASIKNSGERLTTWMPDLDKTIIAAARPSGPKPTVFACSTAEAERFLVLKKIEALRAAGIPYSEMAILVRKNHEGLELLHYFEQNALPVVFEARNNVLKDLRILQFLNLLRLIADPDDNGLFFEVLHYPVWGIAPPDIWKAWKQLAQQKGSFFSFFHDLCSAQPAVSGQPDLFAEQEAFLSPALDAVSLNIGTLCTKLAGWNRDLYDFAFADVFRKVLNESGFVDFLLREDTRLETFNHFASLTAEVQHLTQKYPSLTLRDFLEDIALREEFDEPITDRMLQSPDDVVKIMTAHGSKGLEFEVVFIVNAVSGVWGDGRNQEQLALPEGILQLTKTPESELEETRRLFFVAATRAKQHLIITWPKLSLMGKEQVQSRFLDEIDDIFYARGDTKPSEEQVFARLRAELTHAPHPGYRHEQGFIKSLIDPAHFALSASAFEAYRACPRRFLFEKLIRVPSPRQIPLLLGNAVHIALEEYFASYIATGSLPDPELAIAALRQYLARAGLLEKDLLGLSREGESRLRQYFAFHQGDFAMPYKTELDFRGHGVMLAGRVPITGKIDKVEWIDLAQKTVRIVDYKTSAPKSENAIRGSRGSDSQAVEAGSVYRQLLFYHLLTTLSRKVDFVPAAFRIEFLKPDEQGRFKHVDFVIDQPDTLELTEEVIRMWEAVERLDFLNPDLACATREQTGSCHYCDLFQGV